MKIIFFYSAATISLFLFIAFYFFVHQANNKNYFQVQTEFDNRSTTATFHQNHIPFSQQSTATVEPNKVLGQSSSDKVIYVDLTNQRVYAYEGNTMVYNFLVSTGKWGKTPTGTFTIANKFRYVKMSGGSQALRTYYYLPNVPYTMFFGNSQIPPSRGFAFHGTYWHDNFGHPMSHGCINMKTSEAAQLYYWADPQLPEGKSSTTASPHNPGTKVIIYGTTPKS